MTSVALAAVASFWLVWFPRDTNQPPVPLSFPTYELCRQTAYAYEPENSKWWTDEEWDLRRRADRRRRRLEDEARRLSRLRDAQQLGADVLEQPDWARRVDFDNVWGPGGAEPFVSLVGILPQFERRLVGACEEVK